MIYVSVQREDFDLSVEADKLRMDSVGAIVTFQGIVRDLNGDLEALELEHYPAMTEAALTEFCEEAVKKWSLDGATIIHRYGRLEVGETIMMVATAAAHRRAAFEAADFLMDYLKSRAPFWKKEITTSGADWVAARDEDEDALNRW